MVLAAQVHPDRAALVAVQPEELRRALRLLRTPVAAVVEVLLLTLVVLVVQASSFF